MSTISQDAVALKVKVESFFAHKPSAEGNSALSLLEQLVHVTQYLNDEPEPKEQVEEKLPDPEPTESLPAADDKENPASGNDEKPSPDPSAEKPKLADLEGASDILKSGLEAEEKPKGKSNKAKPQAQAGVVPAADASDQAEVPPPVE